MSRPEPEPRSGWRGARFWLRALTLVLFVPALVVIAWAAFGLQGYQNDPQSDALQTWPAGVASLGFAASLAWIAIRPADDPLRKTVTGAALVAFAIGWAAVLA